MAVLVAAVWWGTHPGAVGPAGNQISSSVEVGRTYATTGIVNPVRPITIRSVEPFRPEGAEVSIEFRACDAVGGGFLLPKSQACDGERDVAGVRIEPGREGTQIRAEITLLEEGVFAMQGVVVEYRDGLRRGRQVTGMEIVMFSEGHDPLPEDEL